MFQQEIITSFVLNEIQSVWKLNVRKVSPAKNIIGRVINNADKNGII